jgi:hypothetical protein
MDAMEEKIFKVRQTTTFVTVLYFSALFVLEPVSLPFSDATTVGAALQLLENMVEGSRRLALAVN